MGAVAPPVRRPDPGTAHRVLQVRVEALQPKHGFARHQYRPILADDETIERDAKRTLLQSGGHFGSPLQ